MSRTTTSSGTSDPLRVLQWLVGAALAVLALVVVAVLAGAVVGSGAVPGVETEVCATRSGDAPAFRQVAGQETGPVGLDAGITWQADEVRICDPDPDAVTRAWGAAAALVGLVGPVAFFWMLWRLLRRARVEGVFADRVPGQLQRLGALLLGWAALDLVVEGLVNGVLLTRMTDSTVLVSASVSWLPVLLGVALLALARVMGEAVDMRRDVEATI